MNQHGTLSILVDTVTGKTWRVTIENQTPVWVPMQKKDQ
jgi:hypothetical protein